MVEPLDDFLSSKRWLFDAVCFPLVLILGLHFLSLVVVGSKTSSRHSLKSNLRLLALSLFLCLLRRRFFLSFPSSLSFCTCYSPWIL